MTYWMRLVQLSRKTVSTSSTCSSSTPQKMVALPMRRKPPRVPVMVAAKAAPSEAVQQIGAVFFVDDGDYEFHVSNVGSI